MRFGGERGDYAQNAEGTTRSSGVEHFRNDPGVLSGLRIFDLFTKKVILLESAHDFFERKVFEYSVGYGGMEDDTDKVAVCQLQDEEEIGVRRGCETERSPRSFGPIEPRFYSTESGRAREQRGGGGFVVGCKRTRPQSGYDDPRRLFGPLRDGLMRKRKHLGQRQTAFESAGKIIGQEGGEGSWSGAGSVLLEDGETAMHSRGSWVRPRILFFFLRRRLAEPLGCPDHEAGLVHYNVAQIGVTKAPECRRHQRR